LRRVNHVDRQNLAQNWQEVRFLDQAQAQQDPVNATLVLRGYGPCPFNGAPVNQALAGEADQKLIVGSLRSNPVWQLPGSSP
jgi:hypothetical protein